MLLENVSGLPQIVYTYLGKTTFEPGETKSAEINSIPGVLMPVSMSVDSQQGIRISARIL